MVLVALALGLPLNDLISVIFLVGGGLLVLTATAIQLTPRRWLLAVIAVVVANLAAAFLPRLAVEEGHNLFLPVPLGAALKDGLPDQVYAHLERRFLEHFPEEQRCSPHNGPGCWLVYPGPDRTFDVSADSLLQSPKYSRTVDHIDFDGLADFRGGFVNRAGYSWRSGNSDVTRRAMPFFVLYDLPKEAAGGRLCWRGEVLWETAPGQFDALAHGSMTCRAIAAEDGGRRVIGVGIDSSALAMRLERPLRYDIASMARSAARTLALAIVLGLLVVPCWAAVVLPIALMAGGALVISVVDPALFGGYAPFEDGGADGITHEGKGRVIAEALVSGDWAKALRGEAGVFYFMPGLRYIRALEKLVFGDTFMGYLIVLLAFPILVYRLFRRFLPLRWALVLVGLFGATLGGRYWGMAFYEYVKWTSYGYPEVMGYSLFLLGVLAVAGRVERGEAYGWWAYWGGLSLAVAVAVRPNLAPGAGALLFGVGITLLLHKRVRHILALAVGFAPILLVPLHNWVFGKKLVLLTATALIPENLKTPPAVYLDAAGEFTRFEWSGPALTRVLDHWEGWATGSAEGWAAGAALVSLALFGATLAVALSRRLAPVPLRLVAWTALAQHAVLWFYTPTDRYAWLTWLLSFTVTMVLLCERWLPAISQKWPGLATRLLAFRGIRHLRDAFLSPLWDRLDSTPREA